MMIKHIKNNAQRATIKSYLLRRLNVYIVGIVLLLQIGQQEECMSLEQAKIHLEAISSSEGRPFDETLTQVIQEQNYKTALDQHAIVAVTDAAGKISHINEMFCKLSGYSRNELIGQSHIIINSTYHTKEFFKDMWKIIAKGQIWRGDICNRAKNGSIYWVRTTIVPFKDSKGKISQYISIRTDITEKIKIQEKLKATNKRLEDLYQQLEDVVKRAKGHIFG